MISSIAPTQHDAKYEINNNAAAADVFKSNTYNNLRQRLLNKLERNE